MLAMMMVAMATSPVVELLVVDLLDVVMQVVGYVAAVTVRSTSPAAVILVEKRASVRPL
jgi:hypothetical protein